MSAGAFVSTFYEANDGDIFLARVQPETITAWNPAPAGPSLIGISANMTGGTRQNGMNARVVNGRWNVGAAPVGYKAESRVRIPVLTIAAANAIAKGDDLAYLGGTFEVTSVSGERKV